MQPLAQVTHGRCGVMGVRYPSLDSIQNAYEAARASKVYASALSDVELKTNHTNNNLLIFLNVVRLG